MKSCLGRKFTRGLRCERRGRFYKKRGVGSGEFEPFISGLFLGLVMFWFCPALVHPNRRYSPVLFLLSQPVDRIQTLEMKLKALEDGRARRSTENALTTLPRHLNRPLNMFYRCEAVELLQSLVRLARNEAHEKADMYAAALNEVKARADLLDKESLQRLLVGLYNQRPSQFAYRVPHGGFRGGKTWLSFWNK